MPGPQTHCREVTGQLGLLGIPGPEVQVTAGLSPGTLSSRATLPMGPRPALHTLWPEPVGEGAVLCPAPPTMCPLPLQALRAGTAQVGRWTRLPGLPKPVPWVLSSRQPPGLLWEGRLTWHPNPLPRGCAPPQPGLSERGSCPQHSEGVKELLSAPHHCPGVRSAGWPVAEGVSARRRWPRAQQSWEPGPGCSAACSPSLWGGGGGGGTEKRNWVALWVGGEQGGGGQQLPPGSGSIPALPVLSPPPAWGISWGPPP